MKRNSGWKSGHDQTSGNLPSPSQADSIVHAHKPSLTCRTRLAIALLLLVPIRIPGRSGLPGFHYWIVQTSVPRSNLSRSAGLRLIASSIWAFMVSS